jgi:hypothetical protein
MTTPSQSPASFSRLAGFVLVFAMILPTLNALFYFVLLSGDPALGALRQLAYALGKTIQFALPIVFVVFLLRESLRGSPTKNWRTHLSANLLLGFSSGVVLGGALLGLYFMTRSSPMLDEAAIRIREKMSEFGISSAATFLALSVFLAGIHSLLEEYYWRWFVFGQLRKTLPITLAIGISSLGFMAHHVVIVWTYAPNYVLSGVIAGSLAVAVGGAVWAWMYERSGSLIGPWVSHALVDVSLFVMGWDLMNRGM